MYLYVIMYLNMHFITNSLSEVMKELQLMETGIRQKSDQ